MSFSGDVKNELCTVRQSLCCRLAECYGMLLCGRSFGFEKILFQTSSETVAQHLVRSLRACFDVPALLNTGGNKRPSYRVAVENTADRKKIMISLGYIPGDTARRIVMTLLERDCCRHAFLRGVFLSCGSLSDPEQAYRMELNVNDATLSLQLSALLSEQSLYMKQTLRNDRPLLYLKSSDAIEDFLTVISASNQAIMLMQSKIYRDMRNKVNRIKNCETANIFKSVDAALMQRLAIEKLEKRGIINSLSTELISTVQLRRENPNATLSELCRLSPEPITRSGLNHRFRKILQLAADLGDD